MKIFIVCPDYWEKCAGEEPVSYIEADTAEEAIEKARPYPWNATFGARAIEAKKCECCGRIVPPWFMTETLCSACFIPEKPKIDEEDCEEPIDWSILR